MDNPWKNFECSNGSMILTVDRDAIDLYNSSRRSESKKVVADSIPSPFIGDTSSARLVLLNLNPGHLPADLENQQEPNFKKAMVLTLTHELKDFPFYPLDPQFGDTEAGKWWNRKLDPLKQASELDYAALSQMIMVIEWFPYHSVKSGLPEKPFCKSQEYSFYLAKKMLHKPDVFIVRMRSKRHWCSASSEFENVGFLTNKQCPWISKGNMDEGLFERIIERLRQ